LIRSKEFLKEAIRKTDARIKILCKDLDKDLKNRNNGKY